MSCTGTSRSLPPAAWPPLCVVGRVARRVAFACRSGRASPSHTQAKARAQESSERRASGRTGGRDLGDVQIRERRRHADAEMNRPIRPPRAYQTDAAESWEKSDGGRPTEEGRRRKADGGRGKAYLIPVSARAATTTQNDGASAMPARGPGLRGL